MDKSNILKSGQYISGTQQPKFYYCLFVEKMNFLSTFVTFENLHEVRRLCHWGPVIALSVIAICSTMAILDSIIWYWPLDTTGGSINFIMLINWTVLILYNYFNAMFVGPGYIPLGWKPVRLLLTKL